MSKPDLLVHRIVLPEGFDRDEQVLVSLFASAPGYLAFHGIDVWY